MISVTYRYYRYLSITISHYRSSYLTKEYAGARTHPLPPKAQFTHVFVLASIYVV